MAQYFEQVLNVADVREANINVIGNGRMPVLGDLNERAISLEEVAEAVNEMKSGKAPGLDGFPVEYLTKGGMAVLEWLVTLKVNGLKEVCASRIPTKIKYFSKGR